MIEPYDGPHIDEFITMQPGDALPEEAYDTPQETLAYLRDGEWTAIRQKSTYRDFKSGLIFVDTFDLPETTISKSDLYQIPFIASFRSIDGLQRYILDMRRLRSLRLQTANLNLDVESGDDIFEDKFMQLRQKRFGTQAVSSFLLRKDRDVHAYVEEDLQVPASIFAQQVDDFLLSNEEDLEAGKSVALPVARLMRSDTKFHRNMHKEIAKLISSTDSDNQK